MPMENNLIQNQWTEDIALIKQRTATLQDIDTRIAFYGSSSIRLWDAMESDLFPLPTINMGFGGSTYQDCLHSFHYLFSDIRPARLVLYAGDNDIANGSEPTMVLQAVQLLVEQIQIKFPHVAISLISIKPSPARVLFLSQIQQTNQLLQSFFQHTETDYIDVFSAMLKQDQQPNGKLFEADGLHLNQLGYDLWASILKPRL